MAEVPDGVEFGLRVAAAIVLTGFAGVFSGLTLGIMGLDETALLLLVQNKAENPRQAEWAAAVLPIRRYGNRLLVTLVLANVAIYSLLPIVIADLAGVRGPVHRCGVFVANSPTSKGLLGWIISTVLSVIFGELLPQAAISSYALYVGYRTRVRRLEPLCL